jgi:hypothetical protein
MDINCGHCGESPSGYYYERGTAVAELQSARLGAAGSDAGRLFEKTFPVPRLEFVASNQSLGLEKLPALLAASLLEVLVIVQDVWTFLPSV